MPLEHRQARLIAGLLLAAGTLAGCSPSTAHLSCEGDGSVSGHYEEINHGELSFRHGVAWRRDDGGIDVLFSAHPAVAEALRDSPNPRLEAGLVGELLAELLIGFEYAADGVYTQRFTLGSSTGSGWSGADRGRIEVDGLGCARGWADLDGDDHGRFALPLRQPQRNAMLMRQGPEADAGRVESISSLSGPDVVDEPFPRWQAVHQRLHARHPAAALQALGLSLPAAERLAAEAIALAALQRLREQCPDPASAGYDDFGDVVGIVSPRPGISLESTVLTFIGPHGPQLHLCYAMARDGRPIEQCFPLRQDCSQAPYVGPND